MKILLVHGRGQAGKDATALKGEWLAGLERGCRTAGVTMPASTEMVGFPFYGDQLDSLVSEVDMPLGPGIAVRGGNDVDSGYLEFRRAVAEEVRVAAGIPDEDVLAEMPPGVRERGPQNWAWVQAILRAIDRHFPRVSDGLLELMTRDVWIYLTAPGVRDEIDAIVADALGSEPTVVVGHSLGSVVAYSVLRRGQIHTVPRYVTLGSPLGLHAIRRRFTPLKFPARVADWFNAYDPRDVVALRGLDSVSFPVTPPIRNHRDVDNATKNRHGVVGYLEDPRVAREIVTAEAAG